MLRLAGNGGTLLTLLDPERVVRDASEGLALRWLSSCVLKQRSYRTEVQCGSHAEQVVTTRSSF